MEKCFGYFGLKTSGPGLSSSLGLNDEQIQLQEMEDIALRWPTTRMRQDTQRDIHRRKRRTEEYESERQYKRHKEREYFQLRS